MHESMVIEAPVQVAAESSEKWLEALPARTYKTKMWGDVPITPEKLNNLIKNFKENVRGQEIAVDFEHGQDPSKGTKAAGWYKDFKVQPSSADPNTPALYALVSFTEEAKKELEDKQWRYFSLEWEDEWEDNDGKKFTDVIIGGGLTNRPIAKRTMPINFSEEMWNEFSDEAKKQFAEVVMEAFAESKEMEHSEPGTGSPPEPRKDEDGSDDTALREGWRRVTPPDQSTAPSTSSRFAEKGGKKVSEATEFAFAEKDARELFHALNLDSTTKPEDVVTEIKKRFSELAELKKHQDATEQEKQFAEQYPQFWDEHNKLMQRDRENSAKAFSESIKVVSKAEGYGLRTTNQGLSTMALEKVEELHKSFAEGKATAEKFEEVIKAIVNGGIVTFGELGSGSTDDDVIEVDGTSAGGIANARKLFSEVVAKLQKENPEWDYEKAVDEAAKKHPDVAEAYRVSLPG